ncbi:MAG: hypothetical protein GC145_02845 [Caulobacter sp.]|nr:hypothetical protein [Caulobacter sp.]
MPRGDAAGADRGFERFKSLVLEVATQPALDAVIAHPEFPRVALAMVEGWGPHNEDDAGMTRTLRDVGHYMAGVWSLALSGSAERLSHVSLTRLFEPLGLGSRTRAHALIAYFRTRGMIRPIESRGDGRLRNYEAAPALRQLFHNRFRRELTTAAPLIAGADAILARWDEPGLFEAFMVANGQFMVGSYLNFDREAANLDVFAQRHAGLTVLGQIIAAAPRTGVFPPDGPVAINLRDIARRSGVSRAQARNVIRAGEKAGFLTTREEGWVDLSPDLRHQLVYLLAAYVLSLTWCANQAMGETV